jgi:outer membrane protein
MKNGLLALNIVLVILVGVLFYLHFSGKNKTNMVAGSTDANPVASADGFRIAYFEMDSVENSFDMVKDVKAELSKKEDDITAELSRMEKEYRNKAAGYQSQAATMNQTQSEMAQRDMMQTQQTMQNRRQEIEQGYQDFKMRKQKEVNERIEAYLKEYNASKKYSYIVSYEPGLFYYKDPAFNITGDLIKGLNEAYKTKKK